jgi:hypothetical protein
MSTSSTGDGTSGTVTGQGSSPDRRLQSPSAGPIFDGEPHGLLAGSDGRQRSPASTGGTSEDPRVLSTPTMPALDQGNRYQVANQSSAPSGAWEDSVPWLVENRVVPGEDSSESGIADALPTPDDEVLALANDLHQGVVRGEDLVSLPPQNQGLIIRSPLVNAATLRLEVENFFSQIDNLGVQPTDKALGMMLSSGAVVVGAAMACEIARRQARRPTAGPKLAVPYAEAPSGIGLPNLGQFSALS